MKFSIFGFEIKVSIRRIDNERCEVCGDTKDWCPDMMCWSPGMK